MVLFMLLWYSDIIIHHLLIQPLKSLYFSTDFVFVIVVNNLFILVFNFSKQITNNKLKINLMRK